MYYDNWSEKSFNQTGIGYCICPNCSEQIKNIRDPSETDICPFCNNKLFTPPKDYNIWKYNGTRKINFQGDIGGIILTIIALLAFAAGGMIAVIKGRIIMGSVFLLTVGFVIYVIVKSSISQKTDKNTIVYTGKIIGESYAAGAIAQMPDPPDHINRQNNQNNSVMPTLFVRYTVLYTKNEANALSYVYDIASHTDLHINETVNVNIRNDNQIWLSRQGE